MQVIRVKRLLFSFIFEKEEKIPNGEQVSSKVYATYYLFSLIPLLPSKTGNFLLTFQSPFPTILVCCSTCIIVYRKCSLNILFIGETSSLVVQYKFLRHMWTCHTDRDTHYGASKVSTSTKSITPLPKVTKWKEGPKILKKKR